MPRLLGDSVALAKIVDFIRSKPAQRLILGIDGFGGSGKSTLADRIGDEVLLTEVVNYDDLFLPEPMRPDFLASRLGIADAYDWSALLNCVLVPFQQRTPCEYPTLDWETQERESTRISPHTRILIVEGVSCLRPELRGFFDYKVWVEAPHNIRLDRGIARDGEQMRSEWVDHWMPAELVYYEACRPDLVVDLVANGTS